MGDQQSGPQEAVKGAVEGVKGKAKEVGGTILGRDDLTEEGQAQQDKADAQRDAGKKEAEAESARRPPRSARRRTNSCPPRGGARSDRRTGPFPCAWVSTDRVRLFGVQRRCRRAACGEVAR